MKNIFKYILTFTFAFVLFGSISVFASEPSPADFKENFQIYRFLAYDVPESDFTYVYDNDEDGRSTQATYKGDEGDCPSSFAYSFRIQSDNAEFKRILPPGNVVMGRVWFNVILPIDEVADLQSASVLIYSVNKGNFWSISDKEKVSDINFVSEVNSYSYGTEWRCFADLYFLNDTDSNADARDFSFQFMFRLKTSFSAPSPYRFATFDLQVQDYYYGSADNPNIPAFSDFEDFNLSVDDYHNMETEVNDLFKSTFDTYLDFGAWETLFTHIIPSITFSTNLLNSWFRLSFIDTLLFSSMFIGLFAFIIGCVPSLVSAVRSAVSRHSRDKSD